MTFKKFEGRLLVRVLLLFLVLSATAYLLVLKQFIFLVFLLPLIAYQIVEFMRFQRKAHEELSQFVEAVHYRDFSRYFDVKHAPAELQPLREGLTKSIPRLN